MSVLSPTENKNIIHNIFNVTNVYKLLNSLKPYLVLLLAWEIIVQLQVVDPNSLPSAMSVGQVLFELISNGEAFGPTFVSIYRMILAFLLAASVGIPIGLLMGRYRPVRWFVDPIVSVAFPTPKIVLLPMFLIWFGFGSTPVILIATLGAVFPIIITTSQGAKSTNKELIWTARSVNMSQGKILYKVVFPSSLPQIFNGLQIGLFLAIVVTVVSEMVSSGAGLGQQIIYSIDYYRISEAFAYLVIIMIIGVVSNGIFKSVQAYVLDWNVKR